jgi:hypothetical protein
MLDEAARWDDLVTGLRPMSYGAKGVPARCLVSVGPTTTSKASSEGWRLRLRPNTVYEFRIVSEHIGTRDLVQEYLANRVFPTMREWSMLKLEGEKKKSELVRLPYLFKFKKHFKEPCQEWLDTIEVMCNEILGNYTKKEDQLMTASFGSRPKRRLNRVMDALHFEYPNYERLNKGAEGQKRKKICQCCGQTGC